MISLVYKYIFILPGYIKAIQGTEIYRWMLYSGQTQLLYPVLASVDRLAFVWGLVFIWGFEAVSPQML